MELDDRVKLAVYRHFAATGKRPTVEAIAARAESEPRDVIDSYRRLRALRVLVLEEDGASIRMASPFSGVPTQHVAESEEFSTSRIVPGTRSACRRRCSGRRPSNADLQPRSRSRSKRDHAS